MPVANLVGATSGQGKWPRERAPMLGAKGPIIPPQPLDDGTWTAIPVQKEPWPGGGLHVLSILIAIPYMICRCSRPWMGLVMMHEGGGGWCTDSNGEQALCQRGDGSTRVAKLSWLFV